MNDNNINKPLSDQLSWVMNNTKKESKSSIMTKELLKQFKDRRKSKKSNKKKVRKRNES